MTLKIHTKRLSRHTRYSLLVAASALPLIATAQSAQPVALEEIVVTAQKKAESLQDTPISISAFSGDMLSDIGAFNATQVGEYTPNVDIYNTFGSNNNITINIRGMGVADPSLSIDPKTGIYLDGVYIARNSGAVFDIVDLERIEVLRGPQGTLWGKNTTGGAMHIITAKPAGEFGFKQLLSGANDGYRRSLTTVDTPTAAGLSAKLSYMKKQYDGFATNTNPAGEKHLGSEDVDAYRVAVNWDISDSLSVAYSYDRTDSAAVPKALQITDVGLGAALTGIHDISNGDYIVGNPLAGMAAIATNKRRDHFDLDFQGKEYVDISGHNLTLSWVVGDVEFKSISAYREYDSDFLEGSDVDGGAWQGFNTNTGQMMATPMFHYVSEKSQQQFSQEFQAVGTALETKLDYVLGIYYFEEQGQELDPWDTTTYLSYSPVLLRGIPMGSWYETDNDSTAVYGQFTYHFNDAWSATLGGRYTEDSKAITLHQDDPRLLARHTAAADWSKFTSSATVDYRFNDDVNLYAKISEGYNAGVFNPGAIDGNNPNDFTVFDQPADEEETLAYEIGLKSTWLDNRLRFNSAIFYNDNSNLQITDFINGVRTTINSGESTTKGVEFDIVAMPIAGLIVDAAYGYVVSDYDFGADILTDDGIGRGTGHLGVSYSFPLLDVGLLTARVDTTYSGKSSYVASSPYAVGQSYHLLNARLVLSEIQLGAGTVEVALWGKNIADKEYRAHGTDFGMKEGFGYTGHIYGDPRSTGIDLVYQY